MSTQTLSIDATAFVSAFVMHSCVATSVGLPAVQLSAGILPLISRVMQFWKHFAFAPTNFERLFPTVSSHFASSFVGDSPAASRQKIVTPMMSRASSRKSTNIVLSGQSTPSLQTGQSTAQLLSILSRAFASAPFSGSRMHVVVLGSVKPGGRHPVKGPEVVRAFAKHFWAYFNFLPMNVVVALADPVWHFSCTLFD